MRRRLLLVLTVLLVPAAAGAENGQSAWLRYARLVDTTAQGAGGSLPASVVTFEDAAPVRKARDELVAGIRGMLGRDLKTVGEVPEDGAIVAGTLARLRQAVPGLPLHGT
jgi:alpha-glucuronidase